MKNISIISIFFTIMILLIILSSCSNNNQVVNPASKYCIEMGGKLDLVKEESGTKGICTTKNGVQCEEWEYYRGVCPKSQLVDLPKDSIGGNKTGGIAERLLS